MTTVTTDRRSIVLYCTDDGQHREWILQTWVVDDSTTVDRMLTATLALPGVYIEYDCRRCIRKPRIRAGRYRKMLATLLAESARTRQRVAIDLSRLARLKL